MGEESLPEEEEKELNQIMSEMGSIYGATNVCFNGTEGFNITTDDNDCLSLSPGLSKIMATSDDPKLRNYVWQVKL